MIKKNNGYIAIREFEIKQAESAGKFSTSFCLFHIILFSLLFHKTPFGYHFCLVAKFISLFNKGKN